MATTRGSSRGRHNRRGARGVAIVPVVVRDGSTEDRSDDADDASESRLDSPGTKIRRATTTSEIPPDDGAAPGEAAIAHAGRVTDTVGASLFENAARSTSV